MKFSHLAIVFCGLLSLTGVHEARAAGAVANMVCTQKGATTMADDEKSILACLYNANKTALIWKEMTESAQHQGSHCGYFPYTGKHQNAEEVLFIADSSNAVPCNGSPLKFVNGCNSIFTCYRYDPSTCPAGYKLISYATQPTVMYNINNIAPPYPVSTCVKQ